jgi:hypothetical protein
MYLAPRGHRMMEIHSSTAWLGLLLLGALHGINPGMGWLFAVALGLQEQKRGAVWRALLPLAAGHGIAIAGAVLVLGVIGLVIPLTTLKWAVALSLLAFGSYKLFRSGHPRWGGMRVGAWDLTVWSLLMATAHGAGLMVLPLLLGLQPGAPGLDAAPHAIGHAAHAAHVPVFAGPLVGAQTLGLAVALVHTAGYLLVTGIVAVIVYEKLGLRLLRTLWFNLDRVWAVALILTAVLTPMT